MTQRNSDEEIAVRQTDHQLRAEQFPQFAIRVALVADERLLDSGVNSFVEFACRPGLNVCLCRPLAIQVIGGAVDQVAPQQGRQPGFDRPQHRDAEPTQREGPEGFVQLPLNRCRAARNDLCRRYRRHRVVLQGHRLGAFTQRQRVPAGIDAVSARRCNDKKRGCRFDCIVAVRRVAADTLPGAGEQTIDDPFRVRGGIVRVGVRHAVVALQASGNQRGRTAGRRPLAGREPGDPEPVELEPGGFEGAEHFDDRAFTFRLEDRVCRHRAQLRDCLTEAHERDDQFESCKVIQQVAPAIDELEIGAFQRRDAGPAEVVQQ